MTPHLFDIYKPKEGNLAVVVYMDSKRKITKTLKFDKSNDRYAYFSEENWAGNFYVINIKDIIYIK